MSNAVRHSFHTASDPGSLANVTAARGNTADPGDGDLRPAPIVIPSPEVSRAFDLFQPEPGETGRADLDSAFASEASSPPVVSIADGQFARQVARALDVPAPDPGALNLPLGGIAPTDREVAAARAVIVGWIAACGIAAFAFLSQGPTLTARPDEATPPPPIDTPQTTNRGDIRLDPAATPKPSSPRAAKAGREQPASATPGQP
jgi:hypothetical protein